MAGRCNWPVLTGAAHASTSRRLESHNMKSYRCYFSDRDSRLRAIRHIVCADHADAIAIASRLLKQNLYTAAGLWHCDQFIGQLLNESDAKAVGGIAGD